MRLALNFILFQLGWFSCVLGAANGMSWAGPIVVLAIVVIHLVLSLRPAQELRLVLSAMVLGLVMDSLLVASGWVAYPGGSLFGAIAPYWIIAMWALFATTLNVSLGWMKNRIVVAILFGAVGGPLSYFGGQKLGAMVFLQPIPALIALAVIWAVAMPLLARLATRFDGVSPTKKTDLTPIPWQASSHA
jgi:hypothetical protein